MATNTSEIPSTEDPLQYPYDTSNSEITTFSFFEDEYNRAPNLLLASLTRYAHLVQSDQASLPHERLNNNILTWTRFAEDSALSNDFITLCEVYLPPRHETRHVFEAQTLNQRPAHVAYTLRKLGDISIFEQLLFPQSFRDEIYVIYLMLPQQSVIEIYTIGQRTRLDYSSIIGAMKRFCSFAGWTQEWQFQNRLHVPATFPVNSAVMTFLLTRELHQRTTYLDLTTEMIMNRKLFLLGGVLGYHDEWLGKLKVSMGDNKSHPFLTTDHKDKDKFPELKGTGWFVIDVVGDGNCGYYVIILGLENLGNNSYSPSAQAFLNSPMAQNAPWQLCVIKLRKDLQEHSQRLLESVYHEGNRPSEWFHLTTATTEDDIDKLSVEFYTEELSQAEYFDRTLTQKKKKGLTIVPSDFQMNPFWTSLVVASYFNIRVIVYTRNTSFDKATKKVGTDWSTTTMNPTLPVNEHITQVEGIRKPSDIEFKQMPTIEILYTTGYVKKNVPDNQHFQFLQRIMCDSVPPTPDPSPETLRDSIMQDTGMAPAISPIPPTNAAPTTDTAHATDTRKAPPVGNAAPTTDTRKAPPANRSKGKVLSIVLQGKVPGPVRKVARAQKKRKTKGQQGTQPTAMTTRATPVQTTRQQVAQSKDVPTKGKKTTVKLVRERKWLMEQLTASFDRQLANDTSKHKVATRMKYDPIKKQYFIRVKDHKGTFQKSVVCHDINEYDDALVKAAQSNPSEWIGPSVGDSGDSNAPVHLRVGGVKTLYEQHSNPYCFGYSLASALDYCGFKAEAKELSRQAPKLAEHHKDKAISVLRDFMTNLVPTIGRATLYGIRTHGSSRKRRALSWDTLFNTVTPYPILVIPKTEDGNATHAFCVVDDIIFDSITPFPLKLQKESVDWIFNGMKSEIEIALRFETKVSPPGIEVEETYNRTVVFHWDHPSKDKK